VGPAVAVLCGGGGGGRDLLREYAGIAAAYGFRRTGTVGYGAGLLVLTFPYEAFPAALLLLLLALTLAMRAADLRNALPRAALLFAGVLYCFGTFRFAIPLRAANPHWLMWGLMLSWIGDTGAYYVGRRWGRHKLARESARASRGRGSRLGGGSGGRGHAVRLEADPFGGLAEAALLAAGINIAGQVGDLAESAIKRGGGVKDSGTLAGPGTAACWTGVTATLFALPVCTPGFGWPAGCNIAALRVLETLRCARAPLFCSLC